MLSDKQETLSLSEASKQKGQRLVEAAKGCFRQACEAGVKIAQGTDAFIAELHGRNAVELALMMEKGGLLAMEAIVAGTKNATACCLLGEQVGTLEAGKLADLLLIAGNPLDDIAILQELERITVYKESILVQ